MRILAFFYFVEGFLYLIYSVWRLVISPLTFFRAPPPLELMVRIFILLMFVAGILFVHRAYSLLTGRSRNRGFVPSICSVPLWSIPALFALGNASTYITSPSIPVELRPYGFYYLTVGVMFVVIGIINLSSLFYLFMRLRK